MRDARILLVAEHDHRTLHAATARVLGAARRLGDKVDLLVAGHGCAAAAFEAAELEGVTRVRCIDAPHYADHGAENLAIAIAQLAGAYRHVMVPAGRFGSDLAPRLAALLDVAQISDVIAVESTDTFIRPVHAGSMWETVRSLDPVIVLTVRASAFPSAPRSGRQAPVESAPAGPDLGVVRVLARDRLPSAPALESARVVVAGGRGLGSQSNFERLIRPLARRLDAAVAASGGAVEEGYANRAALVGQHGCHVAPHLYIAVGISGAIHHVAGIRDARTVVAIDRNPDAPIFDAADFGLVGEAEELIPRLNALLDEIRS